MAPKDPLLGTLKVCVLNLQSDGGVVSDTNPHLASCCELLELVLRKGLQQPVLSLVHRDYWQCLEQLTRQDACGRMSALSLAVEQTRVCKKLLSAQGRGRYLLRLGLRRKALPQFITHLLHAPRVLEWYSPELSILRNEEFVEPFMSLLLVLSLMEFKLDMANCSFLDESWLLPVRMKKTNQRLLFSTHTASQQYDEGFLRSRDQQNARDRRSMVSLHLQVCETYDVVPCREVGMVLRYLSGRVFVLDLTPGSQAHVDDFLRPGDVIDEINGISLRNSKNKQAGVVLSRLKGRPIAIGVLRWRAQDGTVYRPLVKPLRELRMENPALKLGPAASQQPAPEDPSTSPSRCLKEGRIVYIVQFLGKVNIGMFGGREVLQHAIRQVLQRNIPSQEALLDMKETHLTCTDRNSKLELFEHHYPEMSSVGRFGQPDYTTFAFCMTDSPETQQSTGFWCIALKAKTTDECEEIVSRIATGFKHTEWFV
ncbi:uncharacterized protein si:ch211-250n8.1 isoform X2 [Pseudoliparis swirei]|uniref:uncharacterized protein si:ch211-250n8.1 isoform X2 n=1 Tax=Pseudoliparis swirei TaxID=2059687 RepID=UPI0024BDEC82|nr:uncharacterized protein si:ch211-250n8.1 isoform X2 [Pseudoliparis swirei]